MSKKTKKAVSKQEPSYEALFSTLCGFVLSSDPAPLRIIYKVKADVIHIVSGEDDVMMYVGTNHNMGFNSAPGDQDFKSNIKDIGRVLEKIGKIMQEEGEGCLTIED